ncbi:MAG: hypothetical protein K2W95_15685 [Candidatus Obscuribacterales bacterium]|nr:hypothetical protein [Candidatus Obscuribacterales bacterium]
MTEATPPAAVIDPAAVTTPPVTPPAPVPQTPPPAKPAENDSWVEALPEEQKAYIKQLRSEAAHRRKAATEAETKASELQAKIDAVEKAKLEEQGEFKKLYEGEQQKLQELNKRLIRQEIKVHAQKEGLIDLDVADLIVADKVTLTADGKIVGAEEAVASFKTAKPNLFQAMVAAAGAPAAKPTGSGITPPVSTTGKQFDARSLSKEDYEKEKKAFIRS